LTRLNVTVTGAGSLFGQGIIKCLRMGDPDFQLNISGLDYFDTAIGLAWCDQSGLLPDLLMPEISEDDWFDALCTAVIANESKFLFVGADFELLPLARRSEELYQRTDCRVIVSRQELVENCKDKYLTARMLGELGFPTPKSFLPEDGADAAETALGYPMIVKPRFGSRSRGVVVVESRDILESVLRETEQPVMQTYLPDDDAEYTCGVVFIDQAVDTVGVLRRRLRDGNTSIAFSEEHAEIEEFCANLVARLRPFGPLNLQLRVAGGVPYVFEINPRFSGTTVFRAHLGVNEPLRILRHLLGLPVAAGAHLRPGRVMRYFEEIVHLDDA
jgi:carbamoyl-phosphate synthase large subunit